MGLDMLKKAGSDLLSDTKEWGKEKLSGAMGGSFFESLFQDEKTKDQAEKISHTAQAERSSIWDSLWDMGVEWGESILGRIFPSFAKFAWAAEGLYDYATDAEEDVPWEQEFKMIIGASAFIPDFMLRPFTDIIKKPILAILESGVYPGGESLAAKIESEDDPDDLISVLAIMNQDIMTGKVTMKNAWETAIKKFLP